MTATQTPTPTPTPTRHLILSADAHAGAEPGAGYKPYLEERWQDEYDAWFDAYVNPFEDMIGPDADRSWNSDRRLAEMEQDGIVAEVLFPNTVPPFFPSGSLLTPPPAPEDYEHRWAGIRAHNRWLVDFCAAAPGRRAGVAQILLNDIDDALTEIRWAHDQGLFGGILLPGIPPNSHLPPLFDPVYEPIWSLCENLGVVVNHHGGTGLPDFGMHGAGRTMMLVELPIYSHRGLWHLIFAGVFERHPDLTFVMTEQGTGWIPGTLANLDWFDRRMKLDGAAENLFAGAEAAKRSLTPSEYFARNCYVGASFLRPIECGVRHEVGVDRIMWGSDYPHSEGSYPYSREALRASFADVPLDEVTRMLSGTAAEVYGFDVDALRSIADRVGPTVDEITVPLDEFPADSTCNAFDPDAIIRTW